MSKGKSKKTDGEMQLPSAKTVKEKYHAVILNPEQNAKNVKKKPSVVKPAAQKVLKKTQKDTIILPPDHDSYFVYLKHPLEYRRHLLESSRKILFSLRGYQKVLMIRQKKLEEMRKLKNSVKELIYLNKKFNDMLPKYNMSFIEKSEEEHSKSKIVPKPLPKKPVVEANKPSASSHKSEIERLEDSLANIEKKLRTLQ